MLRRTGQMGSSFARNRHFSRDRRRRSFFLSLALAAGMLAASGGAAQIISSNVVGYFNSEYQRGFELIANQLDALENTVQNLLPAPPAGTQLMKLESQHWRTNLYSSETGWTYPEMTLAPGEAALLQSPERWIALWVGHVWEGEFKIEIPARVSLCGSAVPQAGRLTGALQFPLVAGTRIYGVNSDTGEFYLRATCTEAGWEPEDPLLAVGEGFYIDAPREITWKRTLILDIAISPDDQGRGIVLTPEQIPGRKSTVEVSTDLVEWVELDDAEPLNETSVLDRSPGHHAARFYRVRMD